MDYDKVKTRIRQLFALANGNTTEGEAFNAVAKARELMAAHDLLDADVMDLPNEIVRKVCTKGYKRLYLSYLSSVIAKAYGVKSYLDSMGKQGTMYSVFYGYRNKVEAAAEVMDYVLPIVMHNASELERRQRTICSERNKRGLGLKRPKRSKAYYSYVMGFVVGLQNLYDSQNKNDAGMALMVVVEPEVEAAFQKIELQDTKNYRPDIEKAAFLAGRHDGESLTSMNAALGYGIQA